MTSRHPPTYYRQIRRSAAKKQAMKCYYCGCSIWLKKPDEFATINAIDPKRVELYRCTAEHLIPHSSGGKYSARNIVAACHFCNQMRHRISPTLEPSSFAALARSMEQSDRWHLYPSG